jgi:hypothetical protein
MGTKEQSYLPASSETQFRQFLNSSHSNTADHLLWDCKQLRKQRQVIRNSIMKVGGNWPITSCDLANKYTTYFQKFVKTINFEIL